MDDVERRARDLIIYADGAEQAGQVDFAQRARVVARDLLQALHDLRSERSVRRSFQAERDRLRNLLATRTSR